MKLIYIVVVLLSCKYALFQENDDENEGPKCPTSVPEDRLDWCTDNFQMYTCTPQDKEAKENEAKAFDSMMDQFYEIDCMLDQIVESENKTVEEKLEKNRWDIRIRVYNQTDLIAMDKLCKNCTNSDTPEKYFTCYTYLEQNRTILIKDEKQDILTGMAGINIAEDQSCSKIKN